jgi:hypothetical protein
MCTLAWAIVNEDVLVPASVLRGIRVLSKNLVPAEDLPAGLDEHALAD